MKMSLKFFFNNPPNDELKSYPKKKKLFDIFQKHTHGSKDYIVLCEFTNVLQTFPASEAGAEGIFTQMTRFAWFSSDKNVSTNIKIKFDP